MNRGWECNWGWLCRRAKPSSPQQHIMRTKRKGKGHGGTGDQQLGRGGAEGRLGEWERQVSHHCHRPFPLEAHLRSREHTPFPSSLEELTEFRFWGQCRWVNSQTSSPTVWGELWQASDLPGTWGTLWQTSAGATDIWGFYHMQS